MTEEAAREAVAQSLAALQRLGAAELAEQRRVTAAALAEYGAAIGSATVSLTRPQRGPHP